MTLADIVARLDKGIQRDDIADAYPDFVNEALKEIQRRRSWLAMKQLSFFTVPNGASLVSLATDDDSNPTRFKELTIGTSPIQLQNSDLVLTPCEVWPREKILRRQARLISNSILYSVYSHPDTTRRVSVPVWIDWLNAQPTLNILFSADSDLPFSVSYYGYLADLVADGDSNYFTNNYAEMVIAKAKSLAFADINDPAGVSFEDLFDKKLGEAAAQDAYQAVAGMELRM